MENLDRTQRPSTAEEEEIQDIRAVADKVHALLSGPDGRGQFDGTCETVRVVLEVPKALAFLATYLAVIDRWPRRTAWQVAESEMDATASRLKRRLIRLRNRWLELALWNEMQLALHALTLGVRGGPSDAGHVTDATQSKITAEDAPF